MVELYEDPGFSKTLGAAPIGSDVEVIGREDGEPGQENGWKKIKINYTEAWINDQYVDCPKELASGTCKVIP
ncbi:hypothetical protein IQ254_06905 [Nodosilinea sp. LEGE 07088]|uniref:hypothetical protein n=1 Tax=Nodosilinea sp. LEGE 07088 TaxID=2777968 RepID=UPI00187FFB70|nr:hypothetical protein [Nodosilinea sp. LEGE 07088]MBE9136932.1 hypothetical protein [Nodosilinea sp. LEGE 07088]